MSISKCVIRTFSGLEVNPLDLRPEDIELCDVAHALACVNRFAGHTRFPITVAQHSVYVSRLLEGSGYALHGLLHDASEAYLGDMTKWLKGTPEMTAYREAEDRADVAVAAAFGFYWNGEARERVDWADRVMVRFEGRRGFGKEFKINNPRYPELTPEEIEKVGKWAPWDWKVSEELFLTTYRCLVTGISKL